MVCFYVHWCFAYICMCVWVCVSDLGVIDSYELPCGHWEENLGLLAEQPMPELLNSSLPITYFTDCVCAACECVMRQGHATTYMRTSVLSFHCVGSGAQVSIITCSSKGPLPTDSFLGS